MAGERDEQVPLPIDALSISDQPPEQGSQAGAALRNRRRRPATRKPKVARQNREPTAAASPQEPGQATVNASAAPRPRPKKPNAKAGGKSASSEPTPGQRPATQSSSRGSQGSEKAGSGKASEDPASGKKSRKKSQRRAELDAVKRRFSVIQIDDHTYQILIQPSDPDFALPVTVLDIDLIVPRDYPRQLAKVQVNNVEIPRGYALNVELGFFKFTGTLLDRLKQLDRDLEDLLTSEPQKTVTIKRSVKKPPQSVGAREAGHSATSTPPAGSPAVEETNGTSTSESESEWESENDDKDDGLVSSDHGEHSTSDGEDLDDDETAEQDETAGDGSGRPARRGTELVFPNIALNNISLMEISSLNVLVKCGRCKHLNEFRNLLSGPYGHESKPRTQACEKCALGLMVAFRKEFMHSFSNTAGFLDISGGGFADLLPSSFIATCAQCNENNSLFKQMEFGKNTVHACRHCHTKMSAMVDLFRFDMITTDTLGPAKVLNRAKDDKLKLTGGQPLPGEGTCRHYRKSQRWFRFSCCKRVFPCDRCHDEEMPHPVEPALRMLCGMCSKEQRFSDVCSSCGHSFSVRRTAFWEGGKGTRDRTKMSRKDPRKYKRL